MDPHTNSLEATEAQQDKAFREDRPLQTSVDLALGAEQPYLDTASVSVRLAEANRATSELHTLSRSCAHSLTLCELDTVQRCVSAGADVNYKSTHRLVCALARFCMNGAVEAAVLCLQSPNAVHFSTGTAPVLTTILETNKLTSDQKMELIRAAVQHMAEHPEDTVDWSKTRRLTELDFISLAAQNQMLSAVWPVIRDVPYFADHVAPIRLTGYVWRWDFNALGVDQSYFDTTSARWLEANRATGELCRLSKLRSRTCRDPTAVQKCLTNGADVNYRIGTWDLSILRRFCDAGKAEAFRICLSSALPIDFTIADSTGETILLHLLGIRLGSVDKIVELIRAAVQHMAEHPEDTVDWSKTRTDTKLDFISLAAQNQLLSAVWPVIRDVSYFADHVAPIPLTGKVWRWDFKALGADQSYFDTTSASWLEANRATGELYRLSKLSSGTCRDPTAVQKCLKNGADVNYRIGRSDLSILRRFCDAHDFKAVRICLSSALPIHFSDRHFNGEALLLRLLRIKFGSVNERVELLRAAVQHMAEHPEDKVVWSETHMSKGLDFISLAAQNQLLSAVWPVIRDVPYFANRRGHIRLTGKVWQWDFNALGADQSYFDTSSASWCSVESPKKKKN